MVSVLIMSLLSESTTPSIVPVIASLDFGVGQTVIESPSWKSRTDPCTRSSARHFSGWWTLIRLISWMTWSSIGHHCSLAGWTQVYPSPQYRACCRPQPSACSCPLALEPLPLIGNFQALHLIPDSACVRSICSAIASPLTAFLLSDKGRPVLGGSPSGSWSV